LKCKKPNFEIVVENCKLGVMRRSLLFMFIEILILFMLLLFKGIYYQGGIKEAISKGRIYEFMGGWHAYFEPVENFLRGGEWTASWKLFPEGRIWGYSIPYLILRLIVPKEVAFNLLALFQVLINAIAFWTIGNFVGMLVKRKWVKYACIMMFFVMPPWATYLTLIGYQSILIPVSLLYLAFMGYFLVYRKGWMAFLSLITATYAYLIRPAFIFLIPITILMAGIHAFRCGIWIRIKWWYLSGSIFGVIMPLLWGFHVKRATGIFTFSQSFVEFDMETFFYNCRSQYCSYEDCFTYSESIDAMVDMCPWHREVRAITSLIGERPVARNPGAKFAAWLSLPSRVVCNWAGRYATNCFDENNPPIPDITIVPEFGFSKDEIIRVRDSVIKVLYLDTLLTIQEKLNVVKWGTERLREWQKSLIKKYPLLIIYGRIKLFIKNMFPHEWSTVMMHTRKNEIMNNKVKLVVLNLMDSIFHGYIWILSIFFFVSIAIMLKHIFSLPVESEILFIIANSLLGITSVISYVITHVQEFPYYHPSYYIFVPLPFLVFHYIKKRRSAISAVSSQKDS